MYIVLDAELNRLYDLGEEDIINPVTIEDYNTGEYTLEFAYPAVDPDMIVEAGQIILIKDEDDDWTPFQIDAVTLQGRREKVLKVRCVHLYYEIGNGVPQVYSWTNYTAAQAIAAAITDTRWDVGNIDASIVDLNSISGNYDTPLKILRSIATEWTARLKFRATVGTTSITGLYVDLIEIDNEFTGQRFEFGHNLSGIDITTDFSRCYTALTGLVPGALTDPVTLLPQPLTFATAEWSTATGDDATKPVGQTWVGNEASRLLYGIYNPDTGLMEHRHGIYDSGAAASAETLLAATWLIGTRYHFAPQVNVEATIADLSKVRLVDIETGAVTSLDNDKIRVGNVCYVIAENNGLLAAVDARIIRIERYLKEPEKTRIILGDAMMFASDYFTTLADSLEARDARSRPTDRGPGAAVTIASEDTSANPTYADIVVPAGFTNFQASIATAMALLPDEGGQILILEGEYVYDGNIIIDKSNVTITGQGEGTVIKLDDSASDEVNGFYVSDQLYGTTIRDLVLDGNKDNQGAITTRGIFFDTSNDWGWGGDAIWCSQNDVTAKYNFGWRFTPTKEIIVDRIRVKRPEPDTLNINFWDDATEAELAEISINVLSSNTIYQKMLPSPLTFTTGNNYSISYQHSSAMRFGYRQENSTSCPFEDAVGFSAEFSTAITFLTSVMSTVNLDYTVYPGYDTLEIPFGGNDTVLGQFDFGFGANFGFLLRNVIVKNYTGDGISIASGRDGEIVNCQSINNDQSGLFIGDLDSSKSTNIKITGCRFDDNTLSGAVLSQGSDYLIQNNSFSGNDVSGLLLSTITNSSIVGNTFRQTADTGAYTLAGLTLAYSDNNTVTGNTASDNYYIGISIEDSDYNTVSGNVCSNSETGIGIILWYSSHYNTIQNNKCYNNDTFGIAIEAGSNNNQVTNNDLAGNGDGGLADAGTGTITAAGNRS